MEVIPAIDLRGGHAVRLLRGDYAQETDYGDPLEHARQLTAEGATRLHVVDLDAARSGEAENNDIVRAIVANVTVPVEVGGGVRDRRRAEELFEAGVDRVVLGTAAVENPAFARELATDHPGGVVVGLDHRRATRGDVERRVVALRGWEQDSGRDLADVIAEYDGAPLAAFIITDIGADGTLSGVDLDGYALALGLTDTPVIASGGIGRLEHLSELAGLDVDHRRVAGVIIGKALYSGAMTLQEAIATCAASA